jgi:quercetin dioxygenase-like cupin family protein
MRKCWTTGYDAHMKVIRGAEAPEGPVDASHFDGAVTRRHYGEVEQPSGMAVLVRFPPGARTHWHRHNDGQLLFVTGGRGRVGTRDRVAEVAAGDLVYSPPGEQHWHGANPDESLEHLSLAFGATDWDEPVAE